MARRTSPQSRRTFLKTASVAAGAAAWRPLGAPAIAQGGRPKLVYWCYQFLKASDDARADFAQEWAKKNNVDLQMTLVPWKEFMPKITAAIEAKATPDVVESGAVELRGRGQLLDVTDVYKKVEKANGGWVGNATKFMLEPDGKVHHILYGFQGFMLVARDDMLKEAGITKAPGTWVELLEQAKKAQKLPRAFGLGPPDQQPDRLGDLGRHHEELRAPARRRGGQEGRLRRLQGRGVGVPRLLRRGVEVRRAAARRDDLGQHDEQLDVPGGQGGVHPEPRHRLPVARGQQPRAPRQDRALHVPARAQGQIHPVNYGSRAILKYTKVPDVAKQFLQDSMDAAKMDKELSVSQWGPVLKSYLAFDVWKKKSFMKGLVEMSQKGEPEGHPDVFNDAWRESYTNTTVSRMLQRIVVDSWSRDKAFAEAVDVLNKIYAKYA